MFARFRNIFAKSKTEELPIIVVEEAPTEAATNPQENQNGNENQIRAPLASEEEEEDLNGTLSKSSQELSQLLDAINLSSKLPDEEDDNNDDDDDDDNDDTASTCSVKTKIAKASIERDIPTDIEEEEEEIVEEQHSLDKIKALIRNDSETYPQSDYTDTEDNATPSHSHSRTASQDSTAAADKLNLLSCDYSIVPEELPFDPSPSVNSNPSPIHDSGSESCPTVQQLSPSTVTVTPTGSNELACAAISHKLSAIAEVAESLDAVIRDSSHGAIDLSVDLSKKLANGSEDWQSRSTEDESFATASEGNFTPNSHSSSFQTASYIGSAKNSFDEADDSTLSNFEIPELPQSPVNMSFDSSELSYFSAQQPPLRRHQDDDQDSVVGVAELHSQSVTPTPEEVQPNPIESDCEIEAYGLDSSHLISTEFMPSVSTAVTPEVSSADCAASTNNSNNNEQKTTWRRSKYYENITKQTIKGFL